MTIFAITAVAAALSAALAIPVALIRAETARAAPRPVTVRVRSRRR